MSSVQAATKAQPSDVVEALDHIPGGAALSIVIPAPGRLVAKLREEIDKGTGMAAVMIDGRQLALQVEKAVGADLTTVAGLQEVGVETKRAALIVVGVGRQPHLLRVGLHDRRRFDAWLSRWARAQRRFVALDGERVFVLFPESDAPLACLLRMRDAFCQVGLAPGELPLEPLRQFAGHHGKLIGTDDGVRAAAERLEPGADAYILVQSGPIVELGADALIAHSRRLHRFDPKAMQRQAARRAEAQAQRLRERGRRVEGMAAAVSFATDAIRVHSEVQLSAAGAAELRQVAATTPTAGPLSAWSRTPALARLLVHLTPESASTLMAQLNLPVPASRLSGTIATLALGLDTEAECAKAGGPHDAKVIPFVVPLAAAIELRGPIDPAWLDAAQPAANGVVRREVYGSPFEIRAEPQVLLVGTGPGSGAAAHRRWLSRKAATTSGSTPPFLQAQLDLQAIDAAFAAGSFSDTSRRELLVAERIHRQMKPWLRGFRHIGVKAWTPENARTLTVRLAADRRQ